MKFTSSQVDDAGLFAASFAFCRAYGLVSLDLGQRSYTLYFYKR